MELRVVGQKDAEMYYGVGDDDVDGNDDSIDGGGAEINLIEMLVFHQIYFHNIVIFLLLFFIAPRYWATWLTLPSIGQHCKLPSPQDIN